VRTLFPFYALISVFFLGLASYGFKNAIDPDMGLSEKVRRKAAWGRVVSWGLVYVVAVALWWYQAPLKRIISEHQVERLIEQRRPK